MQDIVEQPSERDEEIYAQWESGKTLRVLARQFEVSTTGIERAIDRCLPPFSSASQLRAYKRDLQRLDDVGAYYYAKAMAGDLDSAHIFARVQERRSAISGWSSVNIRLDPYSAQTQQQQSRFDRTYDLIMGFKRRQDGNGDALAPPTAPAADDENRVDPAQTSTPTKDAT